MDGCLPHRKEKERDMSKAILTAMRMANDELVERLIQEVKKDTYYALLSSNPFENVDNVDIYKKELLRRLK